MRTTKFVTKEVEVTDDVFCNMCSESCKKPDCGPNSDPHGLIEKSVRGSYYSRELDDMSEYTFSICESCLKKLFDRFQIPVKITGYDFG